MKRLLLRARWAPLAVLPIWPAYYLVPKLIAHGSSAAFDMAMATIGLCCFWLLYCLVGAWTE